MYIFVILLCAFVRKYYRPQHSKFTDVKFLSVQNIRLRQHIGEWK